MKRKSDEIWEKIDAIYDKWGISEIPFSESASTVRQSRLKDVFTGREKELEDVFNLLRSKERRRLLVYGWAGIGKTAFMLEVLRILQEKTKETLTAYISMPPGADLATTALIALARNMEDDEWAQHQLNLMGLRPRKRSVEKTVTVKAGVSSTGVETQEETTPVNALLFPTLSFEDLLSRALDKYKRVVIAIDDLEKQDPSRARELLRNAQGTLKGEAWFIVSGHESGLTHDQRTTSLGLFDLAIELQKLDQITTYQMLVNYLNSVRPDKKQYDYEDPRAVYPFTPETAKTLCKISDGVPRWLNRIGSYVLIKAAKLKAEVITPEVISLGIEYAEQQLKGQRGLTPEDLYILRLIIEKKSLSDENISLDEMDTLGVKEFSAILPTLEKLVQLDLIRRLPSERVAEFEPSPILTRK